MGKTVVRRILMEEQMGFCAYCFNQMTMDTNRVNTCTREHVKARSDGGKSDRTNIIGCCSTCNQEKSDTPLVIFLLRRTQKCKANMNG